MPVRTSEIKRGDLLQIELPEKTESYTVISYNHVILTILGALSENGFNVESEKYYASGDGKIASGIFVVSGSEDPDLKMVYSFTNSYNKTVRFKCAIGGCITSNNSYLIHNLLNFNKTHRSNADELMEENIKSHITSAKMYFDELVKFKNKMQEIEVTKEDFASIAAVLYMNEHFGLEQFTEAVREYQDPKNVYSLGLNNLWSVYSILSYALRVTHPRKWLSSQQELSLYFSTKYNLEIFNNEEDETDKLQSDVTDENLQEDEIENQEEEITEEDYTEVKEEILIQEEDVTEELYGVNNNPEVTLKNTDLEDGPKEDIKSVDEEVSVVLPGFVQETCPKHEDVEPEEVVENTHEEEPNPEVNNFETTTEEVNAEESSPFIEGTEQEVPEEDQAIYLHNSIMPGLKKGDVFETELEEDGIKSMVTLEITKLFKDVDKDIYYICKEINIEQPESVIAEAQEEIEDEQPEEDGIVYEEVSEEIVEDAPEDIAEEPVTEEPAVEEPVEDTPFIKVIKEEIDDLFGMVHDFTYTIKDGQVNIVLETGETFTITESYVQLKINKKYNIGNE